MIRKVVGARTALTPRPPRRRTGPRASTDVKHADRQPRIRSPPRRSRSPPGSGPTTPTAPPVTATVAQGAVKAGIAISIIEEQRGKQPPDLTDDQWDHGSSDGEIFARHQERAAADDDGGIRRPHPGPGHLEHRQLPSHAAAATRSTDDEVSAAAARYRRVRQSFMLRLMHTAVGRYIMQHGHGVLVADSARVRWPPARRSWLSGVRRGRSGALVVPAGSSSNLSPRMSATRG